MWTMMGLYEHCAGESSKSSGRRFEEERKALLRALLSIGIVEKPIRAQ